MGRVRKSRKSAQPSLRYEMVNDSYRVYPDGREVCIENQRGKAEYSRRIAVMVDRQERNCPACNYFLFFTDATFDHEEPRRMGGGFRDDRIEKDGKPYNRAVHFWCNSERGSRRLENNVGQQLE